MCYCEAYGMRPLYRGKEKVGRSYPGRTYRTKLLALLVHDQGLTDVAVPRAHVEHTSGAAVRCSDVPGHTLHVHTLHRARYVVNLSPILYLGIPCALCEAYGMRPKYNDKRNHVQGSEVCPPRKLFPAAS